MDKRDIEQIIDDGGLLAHTIVQIVGKPKEHVDDTLTKFVASLEGLERSDFQVTETKNHEAVEQEGSDTLFSAFAEVDVVCENAEALVNYCVEAMPSSVEIVEPEEHVFKAHQMTSLFTEMVTRMHDMDLVAKKANQERLVTSKSLGIMIQNAILILLNLGPRDPKGVAEVVGINEDQAKSFLDKLEGEGKVAQKDGVYGVLQGKKPAQD